jgi:hypothetical protein
VYSADNPVAISQLVTFTEMAKDSGVCIDDSLPTITKDLVLQGRVPLAPSRGIVIFLSGDTTGIVELLTYMPQAFTKVFMIVGDASMWDKATSLVLPRNSLILADTLPALVNLIDYFVMELPPQTTKVDSLITEYFTDYHDCGVNLTTSHVSCQNTSALRNYFVTELSRRNTYVALWAYGHIYNALTGTEAEQCTSTKVSDCPAMLGVTGDMTLAYVRNGTGMTEFPELFGNTRLGRFIEEPSNLTIKAVLSGRVQEVSVYVIQTYARTHAHARTRAHTHGHKLF